MRRWCYAQEIPARVQKASDSSLWKGWVHSGSLPRTAHIAKHLLSLAKPVPFHSDICPYLHTSGIWCSCQAASKSGAQALYYLCAIIDLFSRKVVGYRVSHAASTRLVTTTFRNAYEERGNPKNLTFHSDRGGQYISAAFSKLLQQYNVKQSFSASGTPLDNAVAETFFATFKKEETYRREYTSERHFRKSVDEYIRFYNEVRPHQTLKYKTPQAFEATYQSSYIEKPCSYNDAGVWKHLRNFDVSRYTLAIHKKTESLVSQGFPNKKPPVFR